MNAIPIIYFVYCNLEIFPEYWNYLRLRTTKCPWRLDDLINDFFLSYYWKFVCCLSFLGTFLGEVTADRIGSLSLILESSKIWLYVATPIQYLFALIFGCYFVDVLGNQVPLSFWFIFISILWVPSHFWIFEGKNVATTHLTMFRTFESVGRVRVM